MATDAGDREQPGRDGHLFQVERRERILDRIERDGRVDVGDLARTFDVTSETIRRDLTDLQDDQLVRRVHGGAVPWRPRTTVPELRVREGQNADEKRRIAALAALEVPERGSIIIDSGSTASHVADLLDRDRDLTVYTNSIPIAQSLAQTERPRVVLLGGTLRRRTLALVDDTTVEQVRDLAVDVLFFGCDGMTPERGFSTPYRSEVSIKRAMMGAARRTVMMFDHTKAGSDQDYRFAGLEDVDVVITGREIDPEVAARIESKVGRLLLA
jgi:DeoR family fructose operon transcriptional repressor